MNHLIRNVKNHLLGPSLDDINILSSDRISNVNHSFTICFVINRSSSNLDTQPPGYRKAVKMTSNKIGKFSLFNTWR